MIERKLIVSLTAASVLLCLIAAVSCIWYLEQRAWLSAFLEWVAFNITLVGAVYGACWLKDNRR